MASVVTLEGMGKKKPTPAEPPKSPNRADHRAIYARVSPLLGRALDDFLAAQRVAPKMADVLETALREFLEREGFYPPRQ